MTTAPARTRPSPIAVTVVSTTELSATMTRVVVGGSELRRFQAAAATDSYVKLSFLQPGIGYPRPLDLELVHATMPQAHWPVVRTYTVRSWDQGAHELAIDFVVHGDAGVAGPWAAAAQPGSELLLAGPGGAYSPDPDADSYLYIGDESALPAIAASLETLPATAVGQVLIEVPGADSEQRMTRPSGVLVQWVHAGRRPVGQRLVEAARAIDLPVGRVDAFVHGEAGFVKELRKLLRVDRGLTKEQLSISGYWRVGATEEGWRAAKAEWNRQAEDVERAAGVL